MYAYLPLHLDVVLALLIGVTLGRVWGWYHRVIKSRKDT